MRLLIQHLCVLGREALKLPWYADAGIVSSSRSRPRELFVEQQDDPLLNEIMQMSQFRDFDGRGE